MKIIPKGARVVRLAGNLLGTNSKAGSKGTATECCPDSETSLIEWDELMGSERWAWYWVDSQLLIMPPTDGWDGLFELT